MSYQLVLRNKLFILGCLYKNLQKPERSQVLKCFILNWNPLKMANNSTMLLIELMK